MSYTKLAKLANDKGYILVSAEVYNFSNAEEQRLAGIQRIPDNQYGLIDRDTLALTIHTDLDAVRTALNQVKE